ncbi:hypothetical protein [Photobacterium sp. 1_MG-2023]|uniref:hypothetical protein n=1 Tax=Photobacterium sp. 1_MG-2023 TaxID=3062646 RepID=UPI0026E2E3D3|nr:hypothetical protein [Photobacterium sp. 1_MG-2023]MDO6707288.1 hypothetical protein [Photobacterium sp. 1_MG-2023]
MTLSESFNKQAYNLLFLMDWAQFPHFQAILRTHYPQISVCITGEVQKGPKHTIFRMCLRDDFGGCFVHLISDDHAFIDTVLATGFTPPKPMTSFPDINPEAFGSLQGDLDYWFSWLWMPYWTSLTSDEKASLNLPPDWQEFIEFRS